MRVSVSSVDEFLEVLQQADHLFNDIVWISITRRNIDGNIRSASKYDVDFQASAVVQTDENEYLLECGVYCGIDYVDSTDEKLGTKKAEENKSQVRAFADSRQWKVLPGLVSE